MKTRAHEAAFGNGYDHSAPMIDGLGVDISVQSCSAPNSSTISQPFRAFLNISGHPLWEKSVSRFSVRKSWSVVLSGEHIGRQVRKSCLPRSLE
jgi:hypothetical protein